MAWHEIIKQAPTENEMKEFYIDLSKASNRKPAILSLIPPHNNSFTTSSEQLPPLLQELYSPSCIQLDYLQLLQKSKDVYNVGPLLEIQVSHLDQNTGQDVLQHHSFIRYINQSLQIS